MSDYEKGYYWVSYKGMKPVIMEKDEYGWNAMGIEHEPNMSEYTILGKVSEWCSDTDATAILPHVNVSVCPKCGCNKITGDGTKSWCQNEECDFVEAD
ncbi:MAG: hypothetical protein PWQ06_2021 [Anaerophaga sp.]|nr:hypothetical protein [Anaerophaga sp.]